MTESQPLQRQTGTEQFSEIGFLARSKTRVRILRALSEGSVSALSLQQRLDLPRTTLRRNLVELEEKNWIEERPAENDFRITQAGELVLVSFTEMVDEVELACDVGAFLEHLPDSIPADPEAFRTCTITRSTPHRPHAPVSRVTDLVASSRRVELVVPLVPPFYVEMFADRGLDADTARVVTDATSVDRIRREHPDRYATFVESGGEVAALEDTPGFAVGSVDETRLVGTFTDDMRVSTVLEAPADTELAAWVDETYAEWAADAEVIEGE